MSQLRPLSCSLLTLALGVVHTPAWAQRSGGDRPTTEERTRSQVAPPPDVLVRELLTAGDDDQDLEWLYSDAEEYAPTGLVGRPVPAPGLPARGEGSRREWDPRHRPFSTGHYILTGIALAAGAAAAFLPPAPGRFRGINDVDEWGRRNVGINDYERGRWAQDTSDVLLSVAVTYPLLVDSLILMYWYRQSSDVAVQMALISAEAMALPSAIQAPVAGIASRERPYGRDCGRKIPEDLDDCEQRRRYRSFFSGHTTLAFAGAGVSCTHHLQHRIYGNTVADGLSCGGGLALATATGLMRIIGDQHYITDVALGAVVGSLGGFGVPWLLHYGPLARRSAGDSGRPAVDIRLFARPDGLAIGGKF